MPRDSADKLLVWVAEGFGLGRIPFAPGTWGTLLGFAWIWLLLIPQNLWLYLLGTIIGFFAAVYIGGKAEKILNQKDPGRIVIDEIAAMPLAFLGCLLFTGAPPFSSFLQPGKWRLLLLTFFLFRLFDVLKPLGIAKSQNLPGGWGLVIDDFLAALPVAALMALITKWTL